MENYPNNSFKSRERTDQNGRNKNDTKPEKRIAKVVTGDVKISKKRGFRKFIGWFVSEDIENVPLYLWKNIILPAIKGVLSDSVEVALNGETGKRRRSGSSIISEYRGGNNLPNRTRYDIQNLYEIDEIVLGSYGECEIVLDGMKEIIRDYGMVSVLDLWDLLGVTSTRHTDGKYGWTSLNTARIVPVKGGFMLKFPRVVPLD